MGGLEEEDNLSAAVVGGNMTVMGGDEVVDDAVTAVSARPSSCGASSKSAESQNAATYVPTHSASFVRHSSSSASSATGRCPPTHMTPLSRPWTQQRGNSPESPGDRIGNIMAMMMMMMNQASNRDERQHKQEERHKELCLQMELQRQQLKQQQYMMTILLMNAVSKTYQQQR